MTLSVARVFYARMVKKVWFACLLESKTHFTYSSIMKRVQLLQLELDSDLTALIIDEAQDLNPCQADWCLRQALRRQVFFVGDSMQMIYKFRGASSSCLMKLEDNFKVMVRASYKGREAGGKKILSWVEKNSFVKQYSK